MVRQHSLHGVSFACREARHLSYARLRGELSVVTEANDEEDEADPGPEDTVLLHYVVEPNYGGWRLDRYLCEKIRRASRTRVQEIIRTDLVSDRPLKASTPVWPGLRFSLKRSARAEPDVPDVSELVQVYLDEAMLVVNKPAGLPIHPSARYHHHTLTAQLQLKYGAGFRADPAHRLDRETSGLLVCGRTLEASQALTRAFAAGEVEKRYLAIVEGHPPEDVFLVDAPIAEGTALIRIAVRIDAAGKPARTRFEVLRRFERDGAPFSLVRALPETGRQHQIRVHASHAGFPLVGDKMYGPDPGYFDRFSKRVLEPEAWVALRLKRQALHAATLELDHPARGDRLRFEAPLPADLEAFLDGRS
jgi:23S rRNA pseudouridine1911/1915/1917 synthase